MNISGYQNYRSSLLMGIREEFLSPDGNYEGFKECACESDITDFD
jgi:hypothetical protein